MSAKSRRKEPAALASRTPVPLPHATVLAVTAIAPLAPNLANGSAILALACIEHWNVALLEAVRDAATDVIWHPAGHTRAAEIARTLQGAWTDGGFLCHIETVAVDVAAAVDKWAVHGAGAARRVCLLAPRDWCDAFMAGVFRLDARGPPPVHASLPDAPAWLELAVLHSARAAQDFTVRLARYLTADADSQVHSVVCVATQEVEEAAGSGGSSGGSGGGGGGGGRAPTAVTLTATAHQRLTALVSQAGRDGCHPLAAAPTLRVLLVDDAAAAHATAACLSRACQWGAGLTTTVTTRLRDAYAVFMAVAQQPAGRNVIVVAPAAALAVAATFLLTHEVGPPLAGFGTRGLAWLDAWSPPQPGAGPSGSTVLRGLWGASDGEPVADAARDVVEDTDALRAYFRSLAA